MIVVEVVGVVGTAVVIAVFVGFAVTIAVGLVSLVSCSFAMLSLFRRMREPRHMSNASVVKTTGPPRATRAARAKGWLRLAAAKAIRAKTLRATNAVIVQFPDFFGAADVFVAVGLICPVEIVDVEFCVGNEEANIIFSFFD